jgi:hypothetical protein
MVDDSTFRILLGKGGVKGDIKDYIGAVRLWKFTGLGDIMDI